MRGMAVVLTIVCGLCIACGDTPAIQRADPLAADNAHADPGFPIDPRPPCTTDVRTAVDSMDVTAIGSLARGGAEFTCGPAGGAFPLDEAVMSGRSDIVEALLAARANPNARWGPYGDRFALQDVVDSGWYRGPLSARSGIIEQLLSHGANPDARWCPYESRQDGGGGCTSRFGTTPLQAAVARSDGMAVYLLLRAGADTQLESADGAVAIDVAIDAGVLDQLLGALPPSVRATPSELLRYFSDRNRRVRAMGPADARPLTRAIDGYQGGLLFLAPPSAPSAAAAPLHRSTRIARVRMLLSIGADPNERLAGSTDWTPLAIAIRSGDPEVVGALLDYGADPNAGWCAPMQTKLDRDPACTVAAATTPLMFAAATGDREIVRMLLNRGADASKRDWRNTTAADHAAAAHNLTIADDLRRAPVKASSPPS
jgi:ankyrin repeat protein